MPEPRGVNGRLVIGGHGPRTRFFATTGLAAGVVLGFGAPVGSLFFGMLLAGHFDADWVIREISGHSYYYVYMTLLTPLVFGLFGHRLGSLNDRIARQNRSLESLMHVLENKSMIDDVTGLYNHRHLLYEIEKEIDRSKRRGTCLSGIMIDVDGFKQINDLYGHLTGDYVLRELAVVLHQSIRKVDVIGRYGGDEFVVVLPETHLEAAELVCERILENVRRYRFKTSRDFLSLTVSLGLFCFEDARGLNKDIFIEKIDRAMFQAKDFGKDRSFAVS